MITRGLDSAARGMQALIDQNDSTANNVANVNTTGYKKQCLIFKDIYDASMVEPERNGQLGDVRDIGELSVGSQVQKLTYDFSQGAVNQTENPFDLAIQGDGFFKIQSSDGDISYSRNGSFCLNNQSYLVTKDGDYVLDEQNKRIQINTNDVEMRNLNDIIITKDGQIQLSNDKTQIMMQKIGLYDFSNKEDMIGIGGAKFKPTDIATNPELKAEKFDILQGSLEMSNANVVNEMIKTISTSRNYEALSKLVKSDDESLSNVMKIGRI